MKNAKKIITIVLSTILWVIILLAALFAFTTLATKDNNNVSNVGGFTPLVVNSNSMAPTFNEGDMIIIKTCDTSKLVKNDIITFHTIIENQLVLNTHRIIEIKEEGGLRSYITMGDNNVGMDKGFVADADIVGKYLTKLPKMGKVMNFLSSSTGFLLVIVLPILVFFIYQVYHLIMVGIQLKRATAIEQAEEVAKISGGDADAKLAEAQAALEEAMRIKAEAEAKLAMANGDETGDIKKDEEQ